MITFRAVELQDDEDPRVATVYFDLVSGYSEPAQVKGDDYDMPRKEGRHLGNRLEVSRSVELRGFIRGVGGTGDERTLDYRSKVDTVMAAFDMAADPGDLVVSGGYLGIVVSHTLSCRTANIIPGPIQNHGSFQRFSVELQAVDPPEWVETGS